MSEINARRFICTNTSTSLLQVNACGAWKSGSKLHRCSATGISAFTGLEIGFGMTQADQLMPHILLLPHIV